MIGTSAAGRNTPSPAISKKEREMANPFVHVELNTTDPTKAKTFYGSLFNWKMEDVPMGPVNGRGHR